MKRGGERSKPQYMGLMVDKGLRFTILSLSLRISSLRNLSDESLFEFVLIINYPVLSTLVPILLIS